MSGAQPRRMTLGYHRPGDYFYHALIPEVIYALGEKPDESIATAEKMAALTVALHEHLHMMQEMLQGFCWWRESVQDEMAMQVRKVIQNWGTNRPILFPLWKKPNPTPISIVLDPQDSLSQAKKSALELERCDQLLSYPELTRKLLNVEVQSGPWLKEILTEDAYQLTTHDLFECQAALLTQFNVEFRVTEQPSRFSGKVVEEVSHLFQVEKMPVEYGRPLRILIRVFEKLGIRLQVPDTAFAVYSQMRHGAYYLFLSFLLDYSLHISPNPIDLCNRVPDGSTLQDTYPPMRFMNLLFHAAFEIRSNAHGGKQALISEADLYKHGSVVLAKCVNEMHRKQRQTASFVLKNLLGFSPDHSTETFFSVDETTSMWLDYLTNAETRSLFPEAWSVKDRALKYRQSDPSCWFRPDLQRFYTSIGLPILIDKGRGLHFEPYVTAKEELSAGDLERLVKTSVEIYVRVMHMGEEWRSIPDPGLPSTLVPFKFIESVMSRIALHRFALTILIGDTLSCPLTESLGRALPCKRKSSICWDVRQPRMLPKDGCWLRDVVVRLFAAPERFQRGGSE